MNERTTALVDRLRAAARQMVREFQAIDGSGIVPGISLSECHFLMELDARGVSTTSQLADVMLLEKSTVSRLASRLSSSGLLESAGASSDRRQRPLRLTEAGHRRVSEIHGKAESQVRRALDFVPDAERESLLSGLERYAKALGYARQSGQFRMRPIRPEDDAAVSRIIIDVMTEFGAVGSGYSIEDKEVRAMSAAYATPGSAYYVVERDGEILGGGGIGPLANGEPGTCELKKMYFREALRGTGMGLQLLRHCLHSARLLGYRQVYLETLDAMHAARRLYRKLGFTDLEQPMGDTGHFGCNRWMILDLE